MLKKRLFSRFCSAGLAAASTSAIFVSRSGRMKVEGEAATAALEASDASAGCCCCWLALSWLSFSK